MIAFFTMLRNYYEDYSFFKKKYCCVFNLLDIIFIIQIVLFQKNNKLEGETITQYRINPVCF